jgi:hypothetical protein
MHNGQMAHGEAAVGGSPPHTPEIQEFLNTRCFRD